MIRIVGAGAWGTALAILWSASDAREPVELVAHTATEAARLTAERTNTRRLPSAPFPERLVVRSLEEELSTLAATDILVLAVPSDAIVDALRSAARGEAALVLASKGLDASGARVSEAALAGGAPSTSVLVLSGPNLAVEVAAGKPAAAVLAGPMALGEHAQQLLARPNFRLYLSDDRTGVEIGGALKNVIAIGVSAVRSLGYGENAAAALLSRGVAEMARLAEAAGGKRETVFGLAGVGDLALTASNTGSRNARLGELLANGIELKAAVTQIGATLEGIPTAHGALALAARLGVELPITATVVAALANGVPINVLAQTLLGRAPAPEFR